MSVEDVVPITVSPGAVTIKRGFITANSDQIDGGPGAGVTSIKIGKIADGVVKNILGFPGIPV